MYWTERHLLACTGSHCNQKGAAGVINKLRFELMRKGLTDRIHLNTCGTIDLCDVGPNLVVYPDNIILSHLTERDIPAIVNFLLGQDLPEHLVMNADTPEEEQRRGFYMWLNDAGNAVEPSSAEKRAMEMGLAETFLAEQQRRGFMAVKPAADGDTVLSMTSKARSRYRL